jgi:nicotinamidase-related amidase
MTTLPNRPNTAVLVVDVQNGVMARALHRSTVVGNIAALVDRARRAGVPVVWVQHSDDQLQRGSEAWRYVPELAQEPGEPVVHKRYGDSFEETELESVLTERGIGSLVVAGASTDACIMATLHGAVVRGYDATLVEDAHTTEDLTEWGAPPPQQAVDVANFHWGQHGAPGRRTGTVRTEAVRFG